MPCCRSPVPSASIPFSGTHAANSLSACAAPSQSFHRGTVCPRCLSPCAALHPSPLNAAGMVWQGEIIITCNHLRHHHFGAGIVRPLVDITRTAQKEKVFRLAMSSLRNLLEDEVCCAARWVKLCGRGGWEAACTGGRQGCSSTVQEVESVFFSGMSSLHALPLAREWGGGCEGGKMAAPCTPATQAVLAHRSAGAAQ